MKRPDRRWEADRDLLRKESDVLAVLARSVAVDEELAAWRDREDEISGGIAADGLDQALGLLRYLRDGGAGALIAAVERLAQELPPPLE